MPEDVSDVPVGVDLAPGREEVVEGAGVLNGELDVAVRDLELAAHEQLAALGAALGGLAPVLDLALDAEGDLGHVVDRRAPVRDHALLEREVRDDVVVEVAE